ncbi:hypothetical protein [Zavarzinia aquatilis]|uniref:DUF2946 domain-containing protein n=1 Tax=Zavarzinia aquatilis TaxID=2211142 RepID=A0A317EDP5_9PROT|nr:hypothetical protein [Zavarzinia aquatilis]PWR24386.1 hypothetical protein DKG74_09780 [Zavarzinia aquatilis]
MKRQPATERRNGRALRARIALVAALLLFLQPLTTALAADTPLGRLAALMGPLCTTQIPGPGGAPAKAPAGNPGGASCCLPGCPMLGGLSEAVAPLPGPPVRTARAPDVIAPATGVKAPAATAWRQPRAPPPSA